MIDLQTPKIAVSVKSEAIPAPSVHKKASTTKIGRPFKDGKEPRLKVRIYLSKEKLADLDSKAYALGVTRGDYVAMLLA